MNRMLSEEHFGIFTSLNALVTIISILTTVTMYRMINLTSELDGKNEIRSITTLRKYFSKKIFIAGLMFAICFLILTPLFQHILHIDSYIPFLIIGLSLPGLFLVNYGRGMLQGLMNFFSNSINLITDVIIKISIGTIFILFGLTYNAPLLAIGAVSYIAYFFLRLSLQKTINKKIKENTKKKDERNIPWKKIFEQSLSTLLAVSGMILFYTIDILIVRYYFGESSPDLVGAYGTISLLGKIIIFGTQSISQTILPIASKEHAQGRKTKHILFQGIFLVSMAGILITVLYFFFPELIISLLFGERYLYVAPLAGLFGISSILLSLMNVFTNFYLSTKKKLPMIIPFIGIILFFVLTLFHHNSMKQIIYSLIIALSICIFLFVAYSLSLASLKDRLKHTFQIIF